MRASLLLLAALALTAAGSAPARQDEKTLSAAEREACLAGGGRVARLGMLQYESCVRPFADAGKRCRGDADCEGMCRLDLKRHDPGRMQPGQRARGVCQPDSDYFGCNALVENGRYAGQLCAD